MTPLRPTHTHITHYTDIAAIWPVAKSRRGGQRGFKRFFYSFVCVRARVACVVSELRRATATRVVVVGRSVGRTAYARRATATTTTTTIIT